MRRSTPVRSATGRKLALAVIAAGLLALLAAAMGWLAHASASSAAAQHWVWVPMLAFGGVCSVAGWLWGRQGLATRLRDAAIGQQALAELADNWVWQTDAQHRLVSWRPPQTAPSSAWTAEARPGEALFERFEVRDPAPRPGALQARLQAHALIDELRVARLDAGSDPDQAIWRLRALPRFDLTGEFEGYLGTAAPLGAAEQGQFNQALLLALWQQADLSAVALQAGPKGWQVASLSPEAAKRLNIASDTPPADWATLLARAPRPLADALAKLSPGQSHLVDDLNLSLLDLDSAGQTTAGAAGRLLLIRPQAVAATSATPDDGSDHESFSYSVSHDLRAPLRVVEGFARILKEDYGRFLDRIGNDHLDRVLAAGARMNSMIDALLALSRLQSQPLSRKPVDLSQLATYIMEDLQRESPDRTASVHIEPGLVVQGDPTLLRIAMENLLGNAWKYSNQCPQTVIEFRSESRDDGQRVLVVADQGAGFDMRFADRLFGVFQRLHSPKDFQGTGVGLASVRKILRRHGGDIWAESEVGKGARFYFTV
ncbi:sensor histidine kinase [Ideonella sp.]|uniref:sensor histidine kinase n=1 Tax=Ideonella sp. TaxID=1929293 RepID=UPI003BB6DE7D